MKRLLAHGWSLLTAFAGTWLSMTPIVAQCYWSASTGLLPDQVSLPWTLLYGGGAGPSNLTLTPSFLVIQTSNVAENVRFTHLNAPFQPGSLLVIEARLRYDTGHRKDPNRLPVQIGFDTTGGYGNVLFIGADELFLSDISDTPGECDKASTRVNRPTRNGMHTYRLEVDTTAGGLIKVYYDGGLVLTGNTFANAPCSFFGNPRIFWGELSNATWGRSEWEYVRHNASPMSCYGCGANPLNSMQVLSGTTQAGQVLTLGVDDPTATFATGALALLLMAVPADPAYPCGTILTGLGMSGSSGELLLGLQPLPFVIVGGNWSGAGQPVPFSFPVPYQPGAVVHFQGLLLHPTTGSLGLAEGMRARIF